MSTSWHTHLHYFCEHYTFHQPHEYTNSFSSLAITAAGLFGLLANGSDVVLPSHIAGPLTLLVLNGFASFWFHWTNEFGPGMLDQGSMVLAVWCGLMPVLQRVFRPLYARVAQLAASALAVGTIAVMTIVEYDTYFSGLFAALGLSLAGGLYTIYRRERLIASQRLLDTFKQGLASALGVSVVWFTTELPCKEHPWLGYFFGHVFWHVGISWGVVWLLQALLYLDLEDQGYQPYFPNRFFPLLKLQKLQNVV